MADTGAGGAGGEGAARRAGPRGRALAAATPRRLPGGVTASVVPSGQVAAWCGGLPRPPGGVPPRLLDLPHPPQPPAPPAPPPAPPPPRPPPPLPPPPPSR